MNKSEINILAGKRAAMLTQRGCFRANGQSASHYPGYDDNDDDDNDDSRAL